VSKGSGPTLSLWFDPARDDRMYFSAFLSVHGSAHYHA
jgi:hypothetical protein